MNNILPIALLMLLSSRGKSGNLSAENLSPLLSMLGIDGNLTSAFSENGALSDLAKGNFSFEKLLPVITALMNSRPFGATSTEAGGKNFAQKTNAEEFSSAPNYLKPITDIAGDEINYALSRYFANN